MERKSLNLKIVKVTHAGHHKLHLFFSDGKEQIIDFRPFLESSLHTEIRKYLDVKKFKKFIFKNGDLMWGDFDLIFPLMVLYENKIKKSQNSSTRRVSS